MHPTLKRLLPRSLFGRALLILLAPIVLLQIVVAGLFVQRHFAGVTEQMTLSLAQELAYVADVAERAETPQAVLDEIATPLGLELRLAPGAAMPAGDSRLFYDLTGAVMSDTLRRALTRPVATDLTAVRSFAVIRIATDAGVLEALAPRRRTIASNPHLLLVWMVATAAILTVVAVAFLRNQVRPIRQLAEAADDFGKGRAAAFRPSGAEEVRRAGAAFLDMRRRIERQIDQRTRMLSAVSHDLRTPLTRMKLSLALAEDDWPEARELSADVAQMERMVAEFLDFASGVGATEEAVETDPVELARQAAEDVGRAGREVELRVEAEDPAPLALRPDAVRRALANLLDNAARHGRVVRLSLRANRRAVEFAVEDDGPGIPVAEREAAFRPFSRLDAARNLDDPGGGVGLGLAIAQDVARTHGGAVLLEESPSLGGLRAVLRLPR